MAADNSNTAAGAGTTVFLDVKWPDSDERHRVLIKLFPRTSMGEQFLWLCTGERGPTYHNTRLKLRNHAKDGERVLGGDYDNEGGKALSDDLGTTNNRRPENEGDVCGRQIGGVWSAQFAIITRRPANVASTKSVFGRVVEGLDVLKAAADSHSERRPITDIIVVDCGVAGKRESPRVLT